MSETVTTPERDFVPVRFKHIWMGHLITGIMIGVAIFVLAVIGRLFLDPRPMLEWVLLTVLVSVIVLETLMSVVDMQYAKAKQHIDPGGWGIAIFKIVLALIVFFVIGALFLPMWPAVWVCVVAATIVYVLEMFGLKTWKQGMSRQEIHIANQQIIAMTKRIIKE